MYRFLRYSVIAALGGLALFWALTRPPNADLARYEAVTADPVRGETVFLAAGCAACHAKPGAQDEERLVLAGGQAFASDFGTFYAPNISPDPTHGIGAWSDAEILRAIAQGVSPDERHYYPAFPYGAYAMATAQDLADLVAYLRTLPAATDPSRPHMVGFPFSWRRLLGGWRFLFEREGWAVDAPLAAREARGRYLSEALGHCGECHTPRNALGGLDRARWLAGAPNPSGKGRIPNITPAALQWSEADIAAYLKTGFTPDFDTAGGHMAEVVENFSRLSDADRAAVAAYLKAVPAVSSAP